MPLFRPAHRGLIFLASITVAACASVQPAPVVSADTTTSVALPPQVTVPDIVRPDGETAAWWFRAGAAEAAARGATRGEAKNLILFVGDGMGISTVSAARILAGQRLGNPGEEHRLSWEHFPATALSRTYNTNLQTPDSAGTMSAMATGAKTRAGLISVGQSMEYGDCKGLADGTLLTLWELAADAGMETGVVTTTRLTHATPAATLAHVPHRDWESDVDVPAEARARGCTDIAQQMIINGYGNGAKVLMGGGRAEFMTRDQADPEYPDLRGKRGDGQDLVAVWQQRHPQGHYVWNSEQLAAAPTDAPLLGLFEHDHMQWEDERHTDGAGEPSLAEMTQAAIKRLSSSPHGFVLLIEGGRIDHAHHYGNGYRALNETIAMSDAVQAAVELTSHDDTLILVTADHSHTLSFVGYPGRGNPILGKVAGIDGSGAYQQALDKDGLPYTTLVYANGPGHRDESPRPDLSDVDTGAVEFLQEALVPLRKESHGGEDVGIWASGPGSDAVRGSVEQNSIFHFLLQAHPHLRQSVCARYGCTADGVPVNLPRP